MILIKLIVLCVCACFALFLTGCDRDYTDKDADKLANSRVGLFGCSLIDKKAFDNGHEYEDTIWTYEENGWRNLEFHVLEHHYRSGIDDSSWESGELVTDYDARVMSYYLDSYFLGANVSHSYEQSGSDFMYPYVFTYNCYDRNDVQTAVKEICNFMDYVDRHNFLYSLRKVCEGKMLVKYHGDVLDSEFDMFLSDVVKQDKSYCFDGLICEAAMCMMDDGVLSQYTDAEQSYYWEHSNSRIMLKKGDKWQATKYMTMMGNTVVYPSMFFYLAQDEGLSVSGEPDNYVVQGYDGRRHTLTGNTFNLSFSEMSEILGCEVDGEWNVSN